jgi:hypothetical protein
MTGKLTPVEMGNMLRESEDGIREYVQTRMANDPSAQGVQSLKDEFKAALDNIQPPLSFTDRGRLEYTFDREIESAQAAPGSPAAPRLTR